MSDDLKSQAQQILDANDAAVKAGGLFRVRAVDALVAAGVRFDGPGVNGVLIRHPRDHRGQLVPELLTLTDSSPLPGCIGVAAAALSAAGFVVVPIWGGFVVAERAGADQARLNGQVDRLAKLARRRNAEIRELEACVEDLEREREELRAVVMDLNRQLANASAEIEGATEAARKREAREGVMWKAAEDELAGHRQRLAEVLAENNRLCHQIEVAKACMARDAGLAQEVKDLRRQLEDPAHQLLLALRARAVNGPGIAMLDEALERLAGSLAAPSAGALDCLRGARAHLRAEVDPRGLMEELVLSPEAMAFADVVEGLSVAIKAAAGLEDGDDRATAPALLDAVLRLFLAGQTWLLVPAAQAALRTLEAGLDACKAREDWTVTEEALRKVFRTVTGKTAARKLDVLLDVHQAFERFLRTVAVESPKKGTAAGHRASVGARCDCCGIAVAGRVEGEACARVVEESDALKAYRQMHGVESPFGICAGTYRLVKVPAASPEPKPSWWRPDRTGVAKCDRCGDSTGDEEVGKLCRERGCAGTYRHFLPMPMPRTIDVVDCCHATTREVQKASSWRTAKIRELVGRRIGPGVIEVTPKPLEPRRTES